MELIAQEWRDNLQIWIFLPRLAQSIKHCEPDLGIVKKIQRGFLPLLRTCEYLGSLSVTVTDRKKETQSQGKHKDGEAGQTSHSEDSPILISIQILPF